MRLFLIFLLSICSVAQASNIDLMLRCKMSYDIDAHFFADIPATESEGRIIFSKTSQGHESYFFPEMGSAIWHNDASYSINATIVDEKLLINFQFTNYLRNKSKLVTLYNVTNIYNIDFEEIFENGNQFFDKFDGEVLNSQINNDDWVNQEGIKLDECQLINSKKIQIDEYAREEEPFSQSPLQRLIQFMFPD